MRSLLLVLLLGACSADAQVTSGFLSLRGTSASGPRSWVEGSTGRFSVGGNDSGAANGTEAELRLLVESRDSAAFVWRVDALSRYEERALEHSVTGLVEAWAGAALTRGAHSIRARGGMFFLPTSRENTQTAWSSPYSLEWSTWNSWIGEEVRPVGIDVEYRREGNAFVTTVGGTVFGGNDASGALLAWRGWSIGHRVAAFGEVLPLPPLDSLTTTFAAQRDDGTRPVGRDLDGRPGWSARARVQWTERVLIQATHYDNRGDRRLHRGEYAWKTSFDHLGAEVTLTPWLDAAVESAAGSTAMGIPTGVDAGFRSSYVLLSAHGRGLRATLRYERFRVDDRDTTHGDPNGERGDALAGALIWSGERFRAGIQATAMKITSGRPGDDGRSYTAEVRYFF